MSDKKSTFEQFEVAGDKLVETVKNLIHEGNVRRIILKREDGSALLEIPVNAGLVGLALTVAIAPVLLAIGAIAAVVSQVTLVVERRADAAGSVDAPTTTPTAGTAGGTADQDPAASI
jgi:ribosomal protein L10